MPYCQPLTGGSSVGHGDESRARLARSRVSHALYPGLILDRCEGDEDTVDGEEKEAPAAPPVQSAYQRLPRVRTTAHPMCQREQKNGKAEEVNHAPEPVADPR